MFLLVSTLRCFMASFWYQFYTLQDYKHEWTTTEEIDQSGHGWGLDFSEAGLRFLRRVSKIRPFLQSEFLLFWCALESHVCAGFVNFDSYDICCTDWVPLSVQVLVSVHGNSDLHMYMHHDIFMNHYQDVPGVSVSGVSSIDPRFNGSKGRRIQGSIDPQRRKQVSSLDPRVNRSKCWRIQGSMD